jgi:hypothetical protein
MEEQMAEQGYFWARLNDDQLGRLDEAERTLGAGVDVLLAYQPVKAKLDDPGLADSGLQPAKLSDSQLECLQGLEHQLGALVIAYRQAGGR